MGKSLKYDTAGFISELEKIYTKRGLPLTFDSVKYVNMQTKVEVLCKKHNRIVYSKPQRLLAGANVCVECNGQFPVTPEILVKKLKEIWGNKTWDYGNIPHYRGVNSVIPIRCLKHNKKFFMSARSLLKGGTGCFACAQDKKVGLGGRKFPTEEYIKRAQKKHGNKYDYSHLNTKTNIKKSIEITCRKHNVIFSQILEHHLFGKEGCPKCKRENIVSTKEEIIARSIQVYGAEKYDYSNIKLSNYGSGVITLKCIEHDSVFVYPVQSHLQGHEGCKQCRLNWGTSKGERQLGDWLTSIGIRYIPNDKTIIPPKELDIYVPSLKFAIEYNGDYWHSDKQIERNYGIDAKTYHENKMVMCRDAGVCLIFVWEHEWKKDKDNTKQRIIKALLELLFVCYGI